MITRRTSFLSLGWLAIPALPQALPIRDRAMEMFDLARTMTMADLLWLRAYWEREIDRGNRFSDICRVQYAQANAEIARRIIHGRFVGLVEASSRA